ncbi:MAG TPA: S41 family peptidase, partial [Anaerolineaceae bacterium]|nr:S41 family peptidase [Anaerolineaceae bacterium]
MKNSQLIWVWSNAVLGGFAAGFLAWGPLNWTGMRLIGLAVLGGAFAGWCCWFPYSLRSRGKAQAARRVRYAERTILGLGLLTMAGVSVVQLDQLGMIPFLHRDRLAAYDRLCRAIEANYPYAQLKQIDPRVICQAHREKIAQAVTDEDYFHEIQAMLLAFGDSHTYLREPDLEQKRTFAITSQIDGELVVTKAGNIAREAGILPGTVVLAIDGHPSAEIVQTAASERGFGSTPWQREMNAIAGLISSSEGFVQVTYQVLDGPGRTATLYEEEIPVQSQQSRYQELSLVTGERFPSGFGYIKINSFRNADSQDLVAEFDERLDSLMSTPGLILDLRGNPGGSSMLAERIAGRFFSEPFTYGREYYRTRLPVHGWKLSYDFEIHPRRSIYQGKVVLLTDMTNLSAAEQFAVAFQDSGRAVIIGERTSGGSGNPVCFHLPKGEACFSTGDFRRVSGVPLEGLG